MVVKAVVTSQAGRPRRGGRFPGRRGPRGPKPVNVGDVLEVEIVELSRRGDGIARVKGFIIFVPNAKPGEKIKVKVTRLGSSYAVAEATTEGVTEAAAEPEESEEEE